jgi:Ca2+-binding RTX toxin-like protein
VSINGTESADVIYGTSGDDVVTGLGGNDLIYGSSGTDSVDGGAGTDRLWFDVFNSDLLVAPTGSRTYTVTVNSITDSSGTINTSFTGIERIYLDLRGTGDFGDIIDVTGFISGSTFPVYLYAGNGDDEIHGSSYNDVLGAGLGSNFVDAGDGDDNVVVAVDNSAEGTIYVTGSGGEVTVSGNDGNTSTVVNGETVRLDFSDTAASVTYVDASGLVDYTGTLLINDNDGTNISVGSAGKDIFAGNSWAVTGDDVFTGNGGADVYDYTFAIAAMDDTITDFDSDDVIDLQYNDIASGSADYNGGLIADTFIGNAAFSGVAGEYRYYVSLGQTYVEVDGDGDGIADKFLTLSNGQYELVETSAGSNQLVRGADLTITEGSDTITGTAGDDTIDGLSGGDIIYGLGGNDTLHGNFGWDKLWGGEGNDTLYGDNGNDSIRGGAGDDSIDGGDGIDRAYYDESAVGVHVDLQLQGSAQDTGEGFDTLNNIEQLFGSAFDDVLIGDGSANLLYGADGNDTLYGNGGDDIFYTGTGINVVFGGDGWDDAFVHFDVMLAETVYVTGSTADLTVTQNSVDTNRVFDAEVARVIGMGGVGVTVTIDATGYAGTPGTYLWLYDHDGTDIIIGSAGSEGFANTYTYITGNDVFTGNGGADIFDYTWAITGMNGDTITDFDGDDVIDLSYNTASELWANGGYLADHFIGNDSFTGTAGEYRYYVEGGQTFLEADTDGDGVGDQMLTLSNGQYALNETYSGSNILVRGADLSSSSEGDDVITGTEGADQLYGLGGNDTLYGLGGDDTLYGGEGSDDLEGADGNDYLDGEGGDDFMAGGVGDDVYVVDGSDSVWENADEGTDEVRTYIDWGLPNDIENITALGGGNLFLGGNSLDNVITGNSGDNYLIGNEGNDTIDGGDGRDVSAYHLPNGTLGSLRVVDGPDGTLLVQLVQDDESFQDVFSIAPTGTGTATVTGLGIAAFLGTDTVSSIEELHFMVDTGPDPVPENQFAYVSLAAWIPAIENDFAHVGGSDISDTIDLAELYPDADDNDAINSNGGRGNDTIYGTDNGNWIGGDSGNDSLYGRGGSDNLVGGAGNDYLNGGAGDDYILGEAGDDTLEGGDGWDISAFTLAPGTTGTLSIEDGPGGTYLVRLTQQGGSYEDIFSITVNGNAAATVTGLGSMAGYGTDTVSSLEDLHFYVDTWPDPTPEGQFVSFTLSPAQYGDTVSGTVSDDVIDLANYPGALNANGGEGNDTITGTADNNTLSGGGDDDVIDALGGNDTVYGGQGNDQLDGGDGDDFVSGGNGDDDVAGGAGNDTLVGGYGTNTLDGGDGSDIIYVLADVTIASDITVTGTGGNLTVSQGGVVMNTVVNAESIEVRAVGTGGTQTFDLSSYTSGAGAFLWLVDHDGTDIMIGTSGADGFANTYANVSGNDVFTGNGGADMYDYTWAAAGMNNDTITDFDSDDQIDLRFNDPANSANNGGIFADHFIGDADFTGTAGEYRYRVDGGNTYLEADSDGDGVADQVLTLNGQFELVETAPGSNILVRGADVSATEGADIITGTEGDDVIDALGGNDRVNALAGNDTLYGGDGNDSLRGGGGDDTIYGGTGDDRIFTGANGGVTPAGTDVAYGGDGYDIIYLQTDISSAANVVVTGTGGSVTVSVDGTVVQQASEGEEVLVWLEGTAGDTVNVDMTSYVSQAGSLLWFVDHDGTDIVIGSAGSEGFANVEGHTQGNDVFTGNGGADIFDYTWAVSGMNGDTITDFDTDDQIDLRHNTTGDSGTDGVLADTFIGDSAFSGTAGEYRYRVSDGNTYLEIDSNGDRRADQILTLSNGQYALVETAPGSNILVRGEAVPISNGNDSITGTDGDDSIDGLDGNDLISGLAGDDFLNGNSGDDTLLGGEGFDILYGGSGSDSMSGGDGDDIYYVNAPGDTVTENADEGFDTVMSSVSATLGANVENLRLSGNSDVTGTGNELDNALYGNAGANLLTGLDGNDLLNGGGGNDTLDGGAGDDVLYGGAGSDSMTGGTGNDEYNVDNVGDVAIEAAGEGTDKVTSSVSFTLGANIENLVLTGSSNINGTGNDLANILAGNSGANTISCMEGNDVLNV